MPGSGNSILRVARTDLEDAGMHITSAATGIGEAVANAARRIHALDGNWEGMSNQQFMPEFNQSRTRAAAVSDGLTRLGKSLQTIGGTYERFDNVPIEFDMSIEQDASGKASLSYSFLDGNSGEGAHAYNQFAHNGDGSVAVDMQEVEISTEGQPQMSHVQMSEESFNRGGYEPEAAADGSLRAGWEDKFTGTPLGAVAEAAGQSRPASDAGKHFDGTPFGAMGAATGQIGKDGELTVPATQAAGASDRVSAPGDGLLEQNVQERLGMDPGGQQAQSLEERITELNTGAGDVLEQVKNGESPTSLAAEDAAVPRTSGGGGSSTPMQMASLPPLQQPQSQTSADLLQSAGPPEGYRDGDSMADKLMTALVMDELMDDSPLNRMGGGVGGFNGDTPQGVGTMDLTGAMQTLDFPDQEVPLGAPDLDTDPTADNPLAGVEEEFFEAPREMNIRNVNPREAKKE